MNTAIDDDAVETDVEIEMDSEQPDPPADPKIASAKLDHYFEILRLNVRVSQQQAQYEFAKAESALEKKELERLQLELSNLISAGPTPPDLQKTLPFSDDNPDPDAWKQTLVTDVLKLTEAQRDKLDAAGITTMGRFELVRGGGDPDYPRGLRSIKGFGEKTIDAMENDVVEWLSKTVRQQEVDGDV